jgi:hypothetical protein
MLTPDELPLEEILEKLQVSLIPVNALISIYGSPVREKYAPWVATSYTPRKEVGRGNTPREAVNDLMEKLQIL